MSVDDLAFASSVYRHPMRSSHSLQRLHLHEERLPFLVRSLHVIGSYCSRVRHSFSSHAFRSSAEVCSQCHVETSGLHEVIKQVTAARKSISGFFPYFVAHSSDEQWTIILSPQNNPRNTEFSSTKPWPTMVRTSSHRLLPPLLYISNRKVKPTS